MIPAAFDYHRPSSVGEAVRMLEDNPGAKLLAGGHSLLPMMKLRLAQPPALVDIGGLDELRGIRRDGDELVIGALTTHAEVAASNEVASTHRGLAQAAAAIGDVQVRNCGTLGGSLAHADPAADYGAAVLALDATLEILGPDGARTLDAGDLFEGLMQTRLEPVEVVTAVRFGPAVGASAYRKFAQPASGYAMVGVLAAVDRDDDGSCTAARLGATGVSDRPVRLGAAESALEGGNLDDGAVTAACERADEGIDEVKEDQHADADYRRHLIRVMARRAVSRALES